MTYVMTIIYVENESCEYYIYGYMNNIYIPTMRTTSYGKVVVVTKNPSEFEFLLGININEIILFDDGNESLEDEGRIILPKNYVIFVGNKDGELQFKPYEFNQYRIVVTTYQDIITSVDSIG